MTIREELEITKDEQEFIANEILKEAKKLFKLNSKKYISEGIEIALNEDCTNVKKIEMTYKQQIMKTDIKILLRRYRKSMEK